ncbi:MAG: protein kinase [Planctomycetales bacterium]|nr:protein kinase [Planctomycetales bacterium]
MISKPPQLDDIIADYLLAIEKGDVIDPEELVQSQPGHRDELRIFFEDRQTVERMTGPLRFLLATPSTWSHPSGMLGEFRLGEVLGRGGMGIVYRADQTSLQRVVAVKVLPRVACFSSRQLQRFQHEVRATALLKHPNIVPVYAFGCERGTYFYAMELISGGSLAHLIERLQEVQKHSGTKAPDGNTAQSISHQTGQHEFENAGPVTDLATKYVQSRRQYFDEIARIGCAIARALHCTHEQGIVHRDVKPSNILLDDTATPRLTDFGLARTVERDGVTQTGELVGTLKYMSPEQFESTSLVDFRTDIYSLGATLYELLTLRPPFESESNHSLPQAIVATAPKPLRKIDRSIPDDLETIVLRSLTKEPDGRYATADALADDLERFLARRPIHGRRDSVITNVTRWVRRNPSAAAPWAAVCILILLLAVGAPFVAWRQAQLAAQEAASRRSAELAMADAIENRRELQDFLRKSVIDIATKIGNEPGLGDLQRQVLADATEFYDKLVERHGDQDDVLFEAACGFQRLGRIYRMTIAPELTGPLLNKSINILDDLRTRSPGDSRYRYELAACHRILGNNLAFDLGRDAEGLHHLHCTVDLLASLSAEFPEDHECALTLTYCRGMLGTVLFRAGELYKSQTEMRLATDSALSLTGMNQQQGNIPNKEGAVFSLNTQMNVELTCRDYSQAQRVFAELKNLRDSVGNSGAISREALTMTIWADHHIGNFHLTHRDFVNARDAQQNSVNSALKMAAQFPDFRWGNGASIDAYLGLGNALVGLGDYDAALASFNNARNTLAADRAKGELLNKRQPLIKIDVFQALCEWWSGDVESATTRFRDVIAVMKSLLEVYPHSFNLRRDLVTILATCPITSLREPDTAAKLLPTVPLAGAASDWQLQGIVYFRAGDVDRAIDSLQKCIDSGQADAFDCLYLSLCHACKGDVEQAEQWYASAVEAIDAQEPVCLRNLWHPSLLRDLTEEAQREIRARGGFLQATKGQGGDS